MDLITFGRRLMSRVLGSQCTKQKIGEDGTFLMPLTFRSCSWGKFEGAWAMGNQIMGRVLETAVRAPNGFVIAFLI